MSEIKKTSVKMIVSDMDGTLLNEDFEITPYSINIIRRIQEKGIIFVIASGRAHYMMKNYYKLLNMDTYNNYVVGLNGIELYSFKENTLHKKESLTHKEAIEVCKSILKLTMIPIVIYDDKTILVKDNNHIEKAISLSNFLSQKYQGAFLNIQIKTLQEMSSDVINKVCFLIEQESKKEVMKVLQADIGSNANVLSVGDEWTEVVPKTINKAIRIQEIMKQENIKSDEIIVFGDSQNDIEMLKLTNNSYAMKNASEEVKECAKHIANSNISDGVAKEIERLLL